MKLADLNRVLGLSLKQDQVNEIVYKILASGIKIGDKIIPYEDLDVLEQYLRSVEIGDKTFSLYEFIQLYNTMKRNLGTKIVKI